MRHLFRAGLLLVAILVLVFVVLRVVPAPDFLEEFGFHRSESVANAEQWASLPIQYVGSSVCFDCHQDNYALWESGNHKTVTCENCHGPASAHLGTGAPEDLDISRELCGLCHADLVSRPADFPQVDMNVMGGEEACVSCHNPHEPRAGMPPEVPHTLEGRGDCQVCHVSHEPLVIPPPQIPHDLEGHLECPACHGPHGIDADLIPLIPHSLEGRDSCLVCHSANGIKPFPANHTGRTTATCTTCHKVQ